MKKTIIVSTLIVVTLLSGCDMIAKSTSQIEQEKTETNQSALLQVQPPTKLSWSLERDNINKRTNLWNSPNKVSYIYLINYGKVMAFYSVKGKVSSVNSQVTNPEQLAQAFLPSRLTGYNTVDGVLPSPAEDGSYGTNGDGIFFFTTEGAYVEWKGDYMLADQPLKLSTQPELIREIK